MSAFFGGPSADGALVLSVSQTGFEIGGAGSVVLEVSGMSDSFNSMDVRLRVKPVGMVGSSLQLTPPSASDLFETGSGYVFESNSFAESISLDPVTISTTNSPNDTFRIVDGTLDTSDVNVNGPELLARIDFQHVFPMATDPASLVGDQFEFEIDVANSSFLDSGFGSVPFSVGATTGSGTAVSGTTPSAVPEPSTITAMLVVGLGYAARRRRIALAKNG